LSLLLVLLVEVIALVRFLFVLPLLLELIMKEKNEKDIE